MMNNIPLIDISEGRFIYSIKNIVKEGRFIKGEEIESFETKWAAKTGSKEAVAVSSGTTALTLIFEYLKETSWEMSIGEGRDLVILPETSFVATRDAVIHAGLKPVFVDVDKNGLIDPVKLISKIYFLPKKSVLAVVPVHLYGQVVDIFRIEDICTAFNVPFVIEDACQAHGASYNDGTSVGSRNITAWSFMPAKILGTWGDAGAITLPEGFEKKVGEIGNWLRSARDHGRRDGEHVFSGWKGRMDTIKAHILNIKLPRLFGYNIGRIIHAKNYREDLEETPLRCQPLQYGRVWSYFACWAPDEETRDNLRSFLKERDISTGIHYGYSLSGREKGIQAAENAQTTLTLPLWPGMAPYQRNRVISSIKEFFNNDSS